MLEPPPFEVDPDLSPLQGAVQRVLLVNEWLRGEVASRDAELAAARSALESAQHQVAVLGERVADLERRLAADSSTSSRPPSSDSPYRKKSRDRSLREKSGRRPGKQPGAKSSALRQSAHPDETLVCAPAACSGCGAGLAGAAVTSVRRLQEFEIAAPPPPRVTEYQVQARACGRCGTVTAGQPPAGIAGIVQYGPRVHAAAALLACGHHVPVARAAQLMAALAGAGVSAGWLAGVRGKAAARLEPFGERVRDLLRQCGVLYADETPARAAGALRYVHVACTGYLTALHTGDRTADSIDAGGVLPGYAGTIVRDGYGGYDHLTGALHAWCGAHNLRDLRALHQADPAGQGWAQDMAALLLDTHHAAAAARAAGQSALPPGQLAAIITRYQDITADGVFTGLAGTSPAAADALRLARRFARHQDMILRFAADLTVGFTSNQAERDIRPVKVQQHSSGGCWRTLQGLADFAVVQAYLSTAAKWGIPKLDALTQLFTTGPWLPPATAPP